MADKFLIHIYEAMNALTSGYMPGMKDTGSVYIVNYMQNNAFAQALTTDYKMRHMITRDYNDNTLKFVDTVTDDDYGFDNSTDIKKIYRVTDKSHLSEGLEKIRANIGKEVDEGFIYECILGDKMYSWDQIEFSDKVEEIVPFSKLVSNMNESIRNYTLYTDNNIDAKDKLTEDILYSNKSMSTLFEECQTEYLNNLSEAQDVSSGRFENIFSRFTSRIKLDNKNKTFIIEGIDFQKFLARLKEMYQYRGIMNLFEKKYTWWSEYLYNNNKVTKANMKIKSLTVNLFFALELYKILLDLADFYSLSYYEHIAKVIYKKTWISNFEKKDYCKYTKVDKTDRFIYELKDYQLEFVKNYSYLKSKYDLDGYILGFEQGLGKTLTATVLAECLNKDQIIIICPNTLRENWAKEITNYYKKYNNNVSLSSKDIYVLNSKVYKSENPKFIIANQESIEKIFKLVKKNKNSMIIVDECHNFRNIDSDRVKNLLKLKEIIDCKDNLMMSGTPIKATAEEIIPILRMIDPYFTDDLADIYKKSFKNNSMQASDVIKERFGRILYRKTKKELDLPNKYINDLELEISNPDIYTLSYIRDQVEIEYKKEFDARYPSFKLSENRYIELITKYSTAPASLTRDYIKYIREFADPFTSNGRQTEDFLTARELEYKQYLEKYVLSNIYDDKIKKEVLELKSKYVYFKNSVLSTALGKVYPPARNNCYKDIFDQNKDKILSMINSNLKKTIIFTPFLEVAKYINAELTKDKVKSILIVGGTKNRMDSIEEFKSSDDIDILIATTQTLSTGVTLVEANQMFFFGTPYRAADFNQACDRIHRIGQTQDVNIYIIKLKSSKKNLTNRIDEILKWSDNISSSLIESCLLEEESCTYINESKIFSVKDIYYNKDKFDNGDINLCFITGFSGSGKSTLANRIKDVEVIGLDDIVENYRFTDEQLKEYGDCVYKFFTTIGKKYRVAIKDNITDIGAYVYRVTKDYCQFIMQYANSHKLNKFVVEGLQLYACLDPTTLPFKDYAVYIKGTSLLTSAHRATKRNIQKDLEDGVDATFVNKLKIFISQLNNGADNNKYFMIWYNYFKDLTK